MLTEYRLLNKRCIIKDYHKRCSDEHCVQFNILCIAKFPS